MSKGQEASIAVSKALQLLDAFNGVGEECGLSELARRANLPKTTAHRILAQLISSEFVVRVGNRYRLSLRVYELGNRTIGSTAPGIRATSGPFLGDLFLRLRHTAHLAVLDGRNVIFLDKLEARDSPRIPTRVGGQLPAAASALGKAMLAFGSRETVQEALTGELPRMTRNTITAHGVLMGQLRRIRDERVAYDLQEGFLGITCVASPIVVEGQQVAAISVSGPSTGLNLRTAAPHVASAAQAIGREIERKRAMMAPAD